MRSIFAKVVLWSLGTVAISLFAFWAISHMLERRGPRANDPFWSMKRLIEDDVCQVYEDGGSAQLAARMRQHDAKLPGQHFLTDASGRDLVTGEDRSALLRRGQSPPEPLRISNGQFVMIGRPREGRYRYITIVNAWGESAALLPYYSLVVLAIAAMGAILAMHLVSPLRKLRSVVDQFGRGDLSARVASSRRDEIGELSQAFDHMALRIETLMAAERRLLQDVSHELRSPLARLDVAVDLASTSDDPWLSLGRIKRDIGRLTVLVNELLQLTRVEGDPSALDIDEISLGLLLHDLAEDWDLEAEAKGCRVHLAVSDACEVRGERELLHRAIDNIVRNAIRHAPKDTAIEITLEKTAGVAKLEVRDYGPGVPEELLSAIFEPFFRVEGHRSRESGGVGLGLAIARRAIAVHQGHITPRNANPGLAVTIELALANLS